MVRRREEVAGRANLQSERVRNTILNYCSKRGKRIGSL